VPPPGARFVAWLGFVFGSVMSVAANVLHAWLPGTGAAGGVVARHRPADRVCGVADRAPVVGRGALAGALGPRRVVGAGPLRRCRNRRRGLGGHLIRRPARSADRVDYGALGAAVGPLVLDGLMVVSGFALLAMSRSRAGATDSVTGSVTDVAVDSPATGSGGLDA
jgi:hypothetical protein